MHFIAESTSKCKITKRYRALIFFYDKYGVVGCGVRVIWRYGARM